MKVALKKIVSEIKDREFAEFLAGQQIKSILALPVVFRYQAPSERGFVSFVNKTQGFFVTQPNLTPDNRTLNLIPHLRRSRVWVRS